MNLENIRNFCIIAHVDHGKSTLADRMLEVTGTISKEKIKPQMLDTMDLERERGITIKLQPVTMNYEYNSKNTINENLKLKIENSNLEYTLNLIDTPGHVDFSYEVSRSLKAVEGAILLVDATKGIQAQTLANLHLARENNLTIVPVINKVDLENIDVEKVVGEIADLLEINPDEILKVSAKTGEGVEKVLEEIIKKVPSPSGKSEGNFKALIFDSVYDIYRGVVAYVRVFNGELSVGAKIKFLATNKIEEVREVGEFKLKYEPIKILKAGEIGYITTGAKDLSEILVGDTISLDSPDLVSPITGFKKPQPMVFASIYSNGDDANLLRKSLEKLKLNDSSLVFSPENSLSFGYGFRCGFLGLLHLEITKVRLEREYNLDLIVTQPQVYYQKNLTEGKEEYKEPWVNLEIITPKQYLGPIMELAQNKRGVYKDTKFILEKAILFYEIPLSEIIIDFYDKLKSVSSGYASQNYVIIDWRPGDLVKLDIMVAGEKIEEFSRIVPCSHMQGEAQKIALKLKDLIPRQMFEIAIQVATGGKIIARENISAMKKDVTAKLYGGDVTRKNKLLKKQAKGKKRMKTFGRVEIPSDVFIDLLKS